MKENFSSFIIKHRFRAWDLINPRELNHQDYELSRNFDGLEFLWLTQKHEKLWRLGIALMLAEHMAECKTSQADIFAQLVSLLRDDEWRFALKFCPYHRVDVAIKNLGVIQSAMEEACIGLNSAKAGMETAITHGRRGNAAYGREQSKATAQLLNFSALYASYIDVCYRIRDYCGLKKSKAYSNAIIRLTIKNSGAHAFFKDLRNFMSHYHIQAPGIATTYSDKQFSEINLNSADMLYSGFDWKPSSRAFLQAQERVDILEGASSIVRDIRNVVEFHKNLVERKMPNENFAYRYYLAERRKFNHLEKSMTDLNSFFGLKSTLLSRLSSEEFAIEMLSTSLPDNDLKALILSHANRYENLPKNALEQINVEIDRLILKRPRYPTEGE